MARVKNLVPGDKLTDAKTGRVFTVTSLEFTANRVIVLFNGDVEIDFLPYTEVSVTPLTR